MCLLSFQWEENYMIVFDKSSTTAIHPEALQSYIDVSQQFQANPSSLHHLGTEAEGLITQARQQIASFLDVNPSEIIFTSGGTEGDNWALKGTAAEKKEFGKHIIVSGIEHSAVFNTALQLEQLGFDLTIVPANDKGFIEPQLVKEAIRKDTILVSVMAINNEIGSIQPIIEIGKLLEEFPSIHFHVDAVQAFGKIPLVDWFSPRIDFAVFSAHKYRGPRGVGFVYKKEGRRFAPLLTGGGQEGGLRSSTENTPGIAATAKACRLMLENAPEKQAHIRNIQNLIITKLSSYKYVTLFSKADASFSPNIICFGLKGVPSEVLLHAFEKYDIFISTTSACSGKLGKPSRTLNSMGIHEDIAKTAVRVSFNEENTLGEAEEFLEVFDSLYSRFTN